MAQNEKENTTTIPTKKQRRHVDIVYDQTIQQFKDGTIILLLQNNTLYTDLNIQITVHCTLIISLYTVLAH